MLKRKKSYYLRVSRIRKLSGYLYWRLAIYKSGRMVKSIGFYDANNNLLFVNYVYLVYFIFYGLDLKKMDSFTGKYLQLYSLKALLMIGAYQFIYKVNNIIFPKNVWIKTLSRLCKMFFYLILKKYLNIGSRGEITMIIKSKIIKKRSLYFQRFLEK
jgi:hypothetical protein